jgi:hypothetical protein
VEGATLIGPSPNFLEHWALPPDPTLNKNINMISFGNVLYTWKLSCGQTIWDKFEVLLGTSWGTPLGT